MADFNQFGSMRPTQSADAKQCAQFEAMLTDAVDGTLTPQEQAAFDLHLVGCVSCTEMLADAKRGAAWMEMLRHQRPEPPAQMLERIFAQTSGAQRAGNSGVETDQSLRVALGPAGVLEPGGGALPQSNLLPFRKRVNRHLDFGAVGHTLLQPRLAMTAAMAFFSIALTLNLTGVRVSDLRISDLKPSSLKRSLYSANAHVVRYYTNLRVVYELESRVKDLQRSTEDDLPATTTSSPQGKQGAASPDAPDSGDGKKAPEPEPPVRRRVSPGTSRREPLQPSRLVLAGAAPSSRGNAHGEVLLDTFAALFPDVFLLPQGRETV